MLSLSALPAVLTAISMPASQSSNSIPSKKQVLLGFYSARKSEKPAASCIHKNGLDEIVVVAVSHYLIKPGFNMFIPYFLHFIQVPPFLQ